MTSQATRLLDAQTVLVGWINHSATDCYEHSRSSGDVVNLGTDLDAASSFVLVASHPASWLLPARRLAMKRLRW